MHDQDHMRKTGRELVGPVLLSLLALVVAGPAFAVDGVVEINQARALAGAITGGDTAGFPVSINSGGSYRLTSDLDVTPDFDGIDVNADNVTLDLNGFTITGGAGNIADGIGLASHRNIEIRNGTVRTFTRFGIFGNSSTSYIRLIGVRVLNNAFSGIDIQGQANLVDGCVALNNSGVGIRALDGSLVINSIARGNASPGLMLSPTTGYRSNVLTGNNGGDANVQASGGGLELGPNVCGSDLVCP